jgi:asparagine synthase (glutamine-hydrolysing)
MVQRHLIASLYNPFVDHLQDQVNRFASVSQVEIRTPMEDHRFVQFAFSTPESLRIRGDTMKFIHREALRKILPEAIIRRRDKAEFSVAFRRQLCSIRGELLEAVERSKRSWIQEKQLVHLFERLDKQSGGGWHLWVLWSVYGLHIAVDG